MTDVEGLPLPYALGRNREGTVALNGTDESRLILLGIDNYGKAAQEFADAIGVLDDEKLVQAAEEHIWLSAYADNNPYSDYHWQASACYYEAQRRGRPELYQRAYDQARGSTR